MQYIVEVGWMSFVIDDKDLNKFVEMVQGSVVERGYISNRYVTYRPEHERHINLIVLRPSDSIRSFEEFKMLEAEEKAKQETLKAPVGKAANEQEAN